MRCLAWLVIPFSLVFLCLARFRRCHLQQQAEPLPIPVVVVGNITVGGTGKTPVVMAMVKTLQNLSFQVGVISRGYGGESRTPVLIDHALSVAETGDEAMLLWQQCQCPVAIGQDRVAAAKLLIAKYKLDLIISDDGLQHYRLARDLEVVVVDGERGLGNGHCLPAGPLREPVQRLKGSSWVLINGEINEDKWLKLPVKAHHIRLEPQSWVNVASQQQYPLKPLPWDSDVAVTAMAGIGNPERFFSTLCGLGLKPRTLAFDDHHPYSPKDIDVSENELVLMTTKDAIKCRQFAQPNWWALDVSALLPQPLIDQLIKLSQAK